MILYFSGTGNTKYCAKVISEKTNDRLVSINLNLKNQINEIDLKGEKTLGIFSPTYDYNLPWVVSEYLEKLEIKNIEPNLYTYGIFTCGGSKSGMCAKTLEKVLKKKNITLNFNYTVPMPDNYILLYKLDTSKNDIKIKNANELLNILPDKINNREVRIAKSNGLLFSALSKSIIKSQKDTSKFKVSDECIGCSLCSKSCPLNIITMKNNKPVWKNEECSCCLSCINRCPKRAISKGKMSIKNDHYYNELVDVDIK